jgi:hypothetical protein
MRTTRIEIGTAISQAGSLSISYTVEHKLVSIHASDPRDNRKSGISILLLPNEYAKLKQLFAELDEAIAGNLPPTSQASAPPPPRVVSVPDKSEVRITTNLGLVTLDGAVAKKARQLALMESRAAAIQYLSMGGPSSREMLAEALEELVKAPGTNA